MSSETVLSVRNVGKTFKVYRRPVDRVSEAMCLGLKTLHRPFRALDGVSFDLRRGECVGLVGANGAGKSTLLQILAGTMSPTDGEVLLAGRLTALLELGAGFIGEVSGRDNAVLAARLYGMTEAEAVARLPWIEEFSGLGDHMANPVKFFSSGMYARLGFAVAVAARPDVVLVDEALSVGDQAFQERAERHLRDELSHAAKIIVSHDAASLRRACDRVIALSGGRVAFDGGTEDGLAAHASAPSGGPGARRSGLGNVRVEDVAVSGSGRASPGDEVEVSFKLKSSFRRPERCVVGHAWKTASGAMAFGSNTDLEGAAALTVPPGESRWSVSFRWPSVADGRYDLLVGVGRLVGADRQEVECHLDCAASVLSVGAGAFDFGLRVATATSIHQAS